eukprot:6183271-Pleurochrysis_carterae.AAC.2
MAFAAAFTKSNSVNDDHGSTVRTNVAGSARFPPFLNSMKPTSNKVHPNYCWREIACPAHAGRQACLRR